MVLYQQGVTASHDAKAQAGAALGDVYGGLTAGDDGTGRRVASQSGGSGRATRALNRDGEGSEAVWEKKCSSCESKSKSYLLASASG